MIPKIGAIVILILLKYDGIRGYILNYKRQVEVAYGRVALLPRGLPITRPSDTNGIVNG